MTVQQVLSFTLLIWNFVVFLIYGLDKGKAQRGQYRIPERTLLTLAFVGGGIGAGIAGYFFHHKTRKWYFKLTWFLGAALDFGILYVIWR